MSPEFQKPVIESEQPLVVLSVSPKGWKKELNMVSWNGRPAKYDIREWSEDHAKMSKGLTFSKEEMSALKKALNEIEDL